MQNLLLGINLNDRSLLYGGGALLLGGVAALLFVVSLFARRSKGEPKKLSVQPKVIAPSSPSSAAQKLEAPEESVVQIDEDDPRMAAAVAEAKKRLPEFTSAFTKARDGWQFSVKAPFADRGSEESEFMWVHVCRVDFDAVHGTLLNEPEFAKSYKYDDVVRVPLDQIVDWVYSDGEKSTGDFTAKVLDEAAKQAQTPPAPSSTSSPSSPFPPSSAQNDSSANL